MLEPVFTNTLSMVRGDTARFRFQRLDANGDVILTEADDAWFTVKSSVKNDAFKLQKSLSDMTFDEEGYYHFTINPDDTNGLSFGRYFYDVEVIQDGVKSTISIGNFDIASEVTYAINEGGE